MLVVRCRKWIQEDSMEEETIKWLLLSETGTGQFPNMAVGEVNGFQSHFG